MLKSATRYNIQTSTTDIQNVYNINKERLFVPKKEDPIDVVIDILDENIEHKKMMHPYVPPQVQTANVIEKETQQVDHKSDSNQINDAATEEKRQDQITDLIDNTIDENNLFKNIGTEDIWIEDNLFKAGDNPDIFDFCKDILKNIKENDPYLDFNIPTSAIIDDLFEPSDDENNDVTTEDVFEPSGEEPEFIIADPAVPEKEIITPDTNSVSLDTDP